MFIFLSIQGQGTQEWQPGMRGSIEHQIRGDFDARFRWSSKSPAACKQGGKRSKTLWNSCALRWKYIIWIHIILCICNIYIYHYTSYVHVCTGVRTIDYLMGSLEGAFNSWSSCLHHRERANVAPNSTHSSSGMQVASKNLRTKYTRGTMGTTSGTYSFF